MLAECYDPTYLDKVLPPLPRGKEACLEDVRLQIDEGEPPVRLEDDDLEVWEGRWPALKEDGSVDTSATLYKIGCVLATKGASKSTIASALEERDEALGYFKYADRRDQREYVRIAAKVVANIEEESSNGHMRNSLSSRSLIVPGTEGMKDGVEVKREIKVVSFGEISEPAPRRWLVEDLLPQAAPCKLYGDGGLAKSYLALHLATVVAAGFEEWLGYAVSKVPTLYLDFELDVDEQARRAFRIARGLGMERPPSDLFYICALGHKSKNAFQAALNICFERGVGLMILDSENPALQGDAETAKDVIGFYREYVDPFREVGTSVLTIDHQAKLTRGERSEHKRAFGSVFKENLSRSVVQVVKSIGGDDNLTVNLRHTKSNFGPCQDEASVRLSFSESAVRVERLDEAICVPESTTARVEVLKALSEGGPMYPEEIAEITGLERKTVQNTLSQLRKTSLVTNTGERRGRTHQVDLYSRDSHLIYSPYAGARV